MARRRLRTATLVLLTGGAAACIAPGETTGSPAEAARGTRSHRLASSDFSAFAADGATVAIHVSDATRAAWGVGAGGNAPEARWSYWHVYGTLMEALRSDGTPFAVVDDNDILAGGLVGDDGKPRFSVLFSLANRSAASSIGAHVDNFVRQGGHAVLGSSTMTSDSDGTARPTPPLAPAAIAVAATDSLGAATSFNSSYLPEQLIDDDCGTQWINEASTALPAILTLDLGSTQTITRVGVMHSAYSELSTGFSYLVDEYDVEAADDSVCATATYDVLATRHGSNLNREYQETAFSSRSARCIRLTIRSAHPQPPYLGYDTSQWVGLQGVQVFDGAGKPLIQTSCTAGEPWLAFGMTSGGVNNCFDSIVRTDGAASSLLSHLPPDAAARGFRLPAGSSIIGTRPWGFGWSTAAGGAATVLAETGVISDDDNAEFPAVPFCPSTRATSPIVVETSRAAGRYIYLAPFVPLLGFTMNSSPAFTYGIVRKAIDEAHVAGGKFGVRVGAWPWPYRAAFMTRHDHYLWGFPEEGAGWSGMGPKPSAGARRITCIERFSDALTPPTGVGILDWCGSSERDFPVRGSYFLLNEASSADAPGCTQPRTVAMPTVKTGGTACVTGSGLSDCDAWTKTEMEAMLANGAQFGTHTSNPSGPACDGLAHEVARLEAYIGDAADPKIYVSHGAFVHLNSAESGYAGVGDLGGLGIVTKGEDPLGVHPHFALRLGDSGIYDDSKRWGDMVEIPASALPVQPTALEDFAGYGVRADTLSTSPSSSSFEPEDCMGDLVGGGTCMQRAADLTYSLGGLINQYDHIGDPPPARPDNPSPADFDAYINYAQGLPFVFTTSTRSVRDWWKARDPVRVARTETAVGLELRVSGGDFACTTTGYDQGATVATQCVNLEIDAPTGVGEVRVDGILRPACPALSGGAGLRTWLNASGAGAPCYVQSGSRLFVGVPSSTLAETVVTVSQGLTLYGSASPTTTHAYWDTAAVELGVRVRATVAGSISAIRFYREQASAQPYRVTLWSSTGALLSTAVAAPTLSTGWETVAFSTPVTIAANTTYVASYFVEDGGYSYAAGAHTAAITSGALSSPASAGDNGLYDYSASSAFPTSSYGDQGYFVDVVLIPLGRPNVPRVAQLTFRGDGPRVTPPDQSFAPRASRAPASRPSAPYPNPVPGCAECSPASPRISFGTGFTRSGFGAGDRSSGISFNPFPTPGKSSSCAAIARPTTSPSSDGTAFPSCRCADVLPPAISTSSGNVCNRHISRVLSRRLFQWNGPTAGPG